MITINTFRSDKRKDLEPTVSYMNDVLSKMDKMYSEVRKAVTELSFSDNAPHKVARTIIDNDLSQMDSLVLVHKAMYKINDVLNQIALNIYPDVVEAYGDAESVVSSIKLELLNDTVFNRLTSSNAERNREVEFIMMGILNPMGKITTKYKLTKSMISHLEDMSKYINKLDSMVRLKQNILGTTEFESMVANGARVMDASI